jgi:O-antigen/teichoic acid export membrane protein
VRTDRQPPFSEAEPSGPPAESSGSPGAQVAAASAWGLTGRVTLLFTNFVMTPFTIRLLGPARYGLWTLLVLSLSWASQADIGLGSASTKFGAERYSRGDDRGEAAIVWTSLALIAVTTSCVALAIAFDAHLIVAQLLHVHGRLVGPGVLALRIGCGVFVAQSIAGIVNTPQVVRLQFRKTTIVVSVGALVASVGTPLALIILKGGVVTAEAVGLAAALVWALGNFYVAIRVQPELRHPRFDRAIMKQLLSYGGALTVAGLAAIPLTTAERFFLAHNHSTTVVAYYAVAATLATTLQVFPEQLVGPLLPGLARLEAEERLDELRTLYQKGLAGMFLVITPVAIMLAFIAHPFLSLWAGPRYGVHSTVPFLLIIAGVWFNCLAWVPYSYLLSSGRTKVIAYIQIAELVPYIFGAWLLTAKFGAVGAALVWSARFALDSVMCFAAVQRVAPLPIVPLSERRLRSLAGPVLLGCAVVLGTHVGNGLVLRISLGAVIGLAYTGGVWQFVLTARERRGLRNLLAEVVRGGSPPRHSSSGT